MGRGRGKGMAVCTVVSACRGLGSGVGMRARTVTPEVGGWMEGGAGQAGRHWKVNYRPVVGGHLNGLGVLGRVGGCLWQGFGGKGVSIGEAW